VSLVTFYKVTSFAAAAFTNASSSGLGD